jgi:hypothetical protein
MKFKHKKFLSEYELKNVTWVGIEYDREKLINFFDRYNELKHLSSTNDVIEEISIMDKILESHNVENLEKLLSNDFEYCRWATIENLSRKASIEILLDGKYSKETFTIVSNLPVVDFKLIMNRTKELIRNINNAANDAEMDVSAIPGVK